MTGQPVRRPTRRAVATARLRAASGRLQAAWSGLLHRHERPEPRHTAKPPEAPTEPPGEPEDKPGISPAQLTLMDGFPVARRVPDVNPDVSDGPKHRRTK